MKQSLSMLLMMLIGSGQIFAQDSSLLIKSIVFPDKILRSINARSEAVNKKLEKQAERYLSGMEKQERKLRRKLLKIDATAASEVFGNIENQYALLQQEMKKTPGKISQIPGTYLPHFDSLQTALKFINQNSALCETGSQTERLLKHSLGNMKLSQERFSQSEKVSALIKQRKEYLQNQLARFGLTKDLLKLKKQVYYYQAQVSAYKQSFDNPSLLQARAMAALQKTALFQKFFSQHSELAGLFSLPEAAPANSMAAFALFQTRQQTEQSLLARFGMLPDIQEVSMRQSDADQTLMNGVNTGIRNSSHGSSVEEMPDFKPNNQKTRSIIKRLEVGTNLQTTKSNNFFPSTSDLAVSLGYKLNDKSIVGIGSSYKMGWGKDIRHITITHQGVGLRSFLDVKLKGSFWLSGGAEMNYRSQFSNFEILDDYSPWQKSALLGISKKYRVSKTVKGNMQLMYDFLSSQQVPRTQPLVFRIGYRLK